MKYFKIIITILVIILLIICIKFNIDTKKLKDYKEIENILNEYIDTYITTKKMDI